MSAPRDIDTIRQPSAIAHEMPAGSPRRGGTGGTAPPSEQLPLALLLTGGGYLQMATMQTLTSFAVMSIEGLKLS